MKLLRKIEGVNDAQELGEKIVDKMQGVKGVEGTVTGVIVE
ncbi:MAG: hypothetical protein QXP91_10765 [Candidatus Methanomethylicia archaeon]